MDEFAIFKGHRYATVIADAKSHQVIWIGLGRSSKDIRPFFEQLGEGGKNIEAVAMNTAVDLEVQEHCSNARIVYDLFHVVAKFARKLRPYLHGITASASYPLNTCTLEGINNKIK